MRKNIFKIFSFISAYNHFLVLKILVITSRDYANVIDMIDINKIILFIFKVGIRALNLGTMFPLPC